MTKRDLIWISITAVFLILMAVCASAADVGGSCPKPLPALVKHHKKHAVVAPLCTCVADAPRTILLPAPEPDIDLIPLSVYPYYTVISSNSPAGEGDDWYIAPWPLDGYANPRTPTVARILTGGHVPTPRIEQTPEIDPSGAGSALTLLVGGLAVLRGRRFAFDTEGKPK